MFTSTMTSHNIPPSHKLIIDRERTEQEPEDIAKQKLLVIRDWGHNTITPQIDYGLGTIQLSSGHNQSSG